ncbi:hypothetical protein Tco_0764942 [Tanacetum coccineum]
MASRVKVYDAKVSTRTRLYLLKTIGSKLALKPDRYKKFRSNVFGPWLDIRTQEHDNHLINYLLQHQRYVKDHSTNIPFIFDIGQHTLEFGRQEFCLVTGFCFGDCSLDHLSGGQSVFRDRVFLGISRVKGVYLNKLLHNQTAFNNLLDDDVIWLLDTFSNSKTWWVKEKNMIPGCVAWSDGTPFIKYDYDCLFYVRSRLSTLTPSTDKMNKPWWKSSLEYFHNVSNAKVLREVHVSTDVHHYVYEGLSVAELVKKIGDMQRDFQSRITAVEQYVKHHKTSSIGNDSPLNNVFSDTMEFNHDSFGSFTENPDHRVALMNKIMNMGVEFQRHITSIKKYLKISTSSNVEKASNVVEECMEVDKNPSCGSDNHVKHGDKQSMYVDRHVKIRSFKYHMRPLIIINASHLKGTDLGTNLLAIGMDGVSLNLLSRTRKLGHSTMELRSLIS